MSLILYYDLKRSYIDYPHPTRSGVGSETDPPPCPQPTPGGRTDTITNTTRTRRRKRAPGQASCPGIAYAAGALPCSDIIYIYIISEQGRAPAAYAIPGHEAWPGARFRRRVRVVFVIVSVRPPGVGCGQGGGSVSLPTPDRVGWG